MLRLPGRTDIAGNLLGLFDQDRNRWDRGLVAEGHRLLERAGPAGRRSAPTNVEAAIAGSMPTPPGRRDRARRLPREIPVLPRRVRRAGAAGPDGRRRRAAGRLPGMPPSGAT